MTVAAPAALVAVTAADLATGEPRDVYRGPLALALGRALGLAVGECGVSGGRAFWSPRPGRWCPKWRRAWLPPHARDADAAFDRGEPVGPLEFELTEDPDL